VREDERIRSETKERMRSERKGKDEK